LIGLVLFARAIELAQLFVPGRHSRLSDSIVDALAGCAGAVLASITARTLGQES
jgi:VanZ family protein